MQAWFQKWNRQKSQFLLFLENFDLFERKFTVKFSILGTDERVFQKKNL